MRPVIITANWKMNTTPADAGPLAADIAKATDVPSRVKARDTTGAGDTFHGAFCIGLRQGWPLERICVFSSACAALQCKRLGGRPGIPSRDEAIAFLKERSRRFQWDE